MRCTILDSHTNLSLQIPAEPAILRKLDASRRLRCIWSFTAAGFCPKSLEKQNKGENP